MTLEENPRIDEAGRIYAKLYIAYKTAHYTKQDRLKKVMIRAFRRLERRLDKFAEFGLV